MQKGRRVEHLPAFLDRKKRVFVLEDVVWRRALRVVWFAVGCVLAVCVCGLSHRDAILGACGGVGLPVQWWFFAAPSSVQPRAQRSFSRAVAKVKSYPSCARSGVWYTDTTIEDSGQRVSLPRLLPVVWYSRLGFTRSAAAFVVCILGSFTAGGRRIVAWPPTAEGEIQGATR